VIRVVCFSKDRPLQLHGYLSSLFFCWRPVDAVSVAVLVRSEPPYQAAYDQVRAEFPQVEWRNETDFAADLTELVDTPALYTCFGCDDDVFHSLVDTQEIERAFEAVPDLFGFSLRLGENVTYGMWGEQMPQPVFTPVNPSDNLREFLTWNTRAVTSSADWAYPWEVLGTVYPSHVVRLTIAEITPSNPSQLEARGSVLPWAERTSRSCMACWEIAPMVVPTVNVVQSEFPNGTVGRGSLSAEFLLACWNAGLRLDVDGFDREGYDSWRVPNFYLRRLV
jgi:hypothetical protein